MYYGAIEESMESMTYLYLCTKAAGRRVGDLAHGPASPLVPREVESPRGRLVPNSHR